ncbi:branched-chain-amino-acid transaminase [Malassezia cuniculi]|uniref:Branched-chain-amino-acid aminotransferase n=1 Tax=Malassezia cuniculi TaxID=948313 RepID=A0AAF0JA18_9BASI|nr:branched-chain-amino-acid transaminase [Malassezia cuniculi]
MSTLSASRLEITKSTSARKCPPVNELVFGKTFTNHMLTVPWNIESGWGTPKIEAYHPLSLDPSAVVFHYAPCLFEGLKAYRDPKGEIRLFRPDKNMERMNASAHRLALPQFDGDELIKLIKKLLEIDQEWVPSEPGYSLYIRPTLIGTQASLGISQSTEALLFVILSPVGPYYSSVVKPVALEANPDRVRAWPGGSGSSKLGANYAPCILPQMESASKGYQQNLWLYGEEHWLTEVGAMNLFIVLRNDDGLEVVTPPLNGMILPGVTRDSLLSLLRDHVAGKNSLPLPKNIKVSEREIKMGEIVDAANAGRLVEAFGSGTAAVVSPVDRIGYKGSDIKVPVTESGFGEVAEALLNKLKSIQWGHEEHPWSVPISS